MSSRFLAFALVASLLVFGASSVALSSAYAQGDDLWYPGEGIQADTYFKYRIEEYQTNDRQPFELTLYFQEQDQDGDWIVPAFVVDQGKVIEGTWRLSDSMTYLAGRSEIPPEMGDFVGGYAGSVHWIDSFTTKEDPKSLSAGNWGRTGSIGGSDLKPSGQETITAGGKQYETTVLIVHKGVDSKIWVQNGFPFAIAADFFTDTTSGTPQTQFKFELLETGKGKPETPAGEEQVPTPPLSGKTGRGTYEISLDWEPATIEPGKLVRFTVSLMDDTGFPLERANYDFTVKGSDGSVIQEFKNQNADVEFGTGTHEVQLDAAGPMTVTVKINAVGSQPPSQFNESVDFSVVVVPEFPVSAAIVAAAVIGLVVVMTRARGGLFGTRGAL